jgi:hypothetical protein
MNKKELMESINKAWCDLEDSMLYLLIPLTLFYSSIVL